MYLCIMYYVFCHMTVIETGSNIKRERNYINEKTREYIFFLACILTFPIFFNTTLDCRHGQSPIYSLRPSYTHIHLYITAHI